MNVEAGGSFLSRTRDWLTAKPLPGSERAGLNGAEVLDVLTVLGGSGTFAAVAAEAAAHTGMLTGTHAALTAVTAVAAAVGARAVTRYRQGKAVAKKPKDGPKGQPAPKPKPDPKPPKPNGPGLPGTYAPPAGPNILTDPSDPGKTTTVNDSALVNLVALAANPTGPWPFGLWKWLNDFQDWLRDHPGWFIGPTVIPVLPGPPLPHPLPPDPDA